MEENIKQSGTVIDTAKISESIHVLSIASGMPEDEIMNNIIKVKQKSEGLYEMHLEPNDKIFQSHSLMNEKILFIKIILRYGYTRIKNWGFRLL